MMPILGNSLMVRLVTVFICVAVIPIAVVGYLSFDRAKTALYDSELKKLTELRDEKAAEVKRYVHSVVDTSKFLADYGRVEMALLELPYDEQLGKILSSVDFSKEGETREQAILYLLNRMMGQYVQLLGDDIALEDVLVVRPTGRVIYSVKRLGDLGSDLTTGNLRDSGLARVWDRVVKTQKPAVTDLAVYALTGQPAFFVGAPVFSRKDNRFSGVLIMRMGGGHTNTIMNVTDSAGKTAEVYLVGKDHLMRSKPRLGTGGDPVLRLKVDTEAAKEALADRKGAKIVNDYRGVPVFSSFGDVGLNERKELGTDFDWAIIAEIDEAEAIQPAVQLGHRIIVIALGVAAVVALVGFFAARNIARPIVALSEKVVQVSTGDLTVDVGVQRRRDEIGQLTAAFGEMVKNLREQTRKTLEGVNVLSSSAAEISATVAQLSASTAKTSTAVSETTTTVEEVKQAAQVSSEKAKKVAESSHKAVQVSEDGRAATEQTIGKMQLIREQMESIGETVVRLSEHGKAIEDIIAAVQDLADQSNLLAVNASIEAARAGDQGKGFAVVAHEIKSLADQSRKATEQVRSILAETRKWVAAVVMATEQGSKAVQAGVEQSVRAGQSIESLWASVAESSQAASVIETSAGQQFVGVDQVSGAMVNIEQAMQQNLAGTSQLKAAAQKLNELGEELKRQVEQYKV